MTGKLTMLGYAACLIAGPAVAAFAVGTTDTTGPSGTATAPAYSAPGSATGSTAGQAQMSAAQRDEWAATHPGAANNGSYATQSGVAGGGGTGGPGGSDGGAGAGSSGR